MSCSPEGATEFSSLPNPSSHIMTLGFIQPLTEIKMFVGSRVRPVHKADNRTAICEPTLENVVSLTSHIPIGLHSLLQG
jgi:hypothetical protein